MATLWDYQNQLRKIAEHRTSGAEQEILAVYSSVLQRLQSIVGRYYTVYSNGEGTLSAADLRLAGQYKGFLQDVLHGLEQLSEPQQEAIRSAVESAYTVCYDGMAAAVKEAASGSTTLQNALHGLSASTPETVAHIVEHPMQKLTLSHLLQGSEYLEVKEWCSAEDGDVRDAHRKLDGKVIPATEAFEIDGKKAQCPGGFGVAELDINCRCFLKYALVKREDFEKKHGKIRDEALTSGGDGGIIKEDNRAVRLWYHKRIHGIPDEIPAGLPMEERAKKAFELRNYYRAEARKRMADEEARAELESIRPNPTFEELIESKMRRKKMTREEAVEDIYKTAVKSNPEYDKRAGL